MAIKFRKLAKKDARKVYLSGKKHFASPKEYSWDWSIEKVRRYARPSFGTSIIATDNGKIVGFALAENNYSSQKPNVGWFTYVLVHPFYRGHKLGEMLLEQALQKMKDKGVKEVITDIYTKNKDSLKFFASNGFTVKEKWVIMSRKI